MTEEKKSSDRILEKLEKFETSMATLKTLIESHSPPPIPEPTPQPQPTPQPTLSEEKHEHWKADDLLTSSCPECKKEVERIGKDYMQKSLKERKDYQFECEDCGTHVRKEEENCPTCGGKKAKSRQQ